MDGRVHYPQENPHAIPRQQSMFNQDCQESTNDVYGGDDGFRTSSDMAMQSDGGEFYDSMPQQEEAHHPHEMRCRSCGAGSCMHARVASCTGADSQQLNAIIDRLMEELREKDRTFQYERERRERAEAALARSEERSLALIKSAYPLAPSAPSYPSYPSASTDVYVADVYRDKQYRPSSSSSKQTSDSRVRSPADISLDDTATLSAGGLSTSHNRLTYYTPSAGTGASQLSFTGQRAIDDERVSQRPSASINVQERFDTPRHASNNVVPAITGRNNAMWGKSHLVWIIVPLIILAVIVAAWVAWRLLTKSGRAAPRVLTAYDLPPYPSQHSATMQHLSGSFGGGGGAGGAGGGPMPNGSIHAYVPNSGAIGGYTNSMHTPSPSMPSTASFGLSPAYMSYGGTINGGTPPSPNRPPYGVRYSGN